MVVRLSELCLGDNWTSESMHFFDPESVGVVDILDLFYKRYVNRGNVGEMRLKL